MMDLILELIHTRKFHDAREALAEMNTVDLAEALIELPQPDLIRVFRMLPKDMAAEVFSYLTRDAQKRIIDTITDQEISEIMTELFLDDTVDMIEEMPANVVKRLLRNTDQKTRILINQLLQYPEHSAGSIMTVEFVDLRKAMTVRQAFEHIRQTGLDKETIYTGYVTDNQRHLEGLISIKTLLPPVSISMGIKATSAGMTARESSKKVMINPVKIADTIRKSSQGIRLRAWTPMLVSR